MDYNNISDFVFLMFIDTNQKSRRTKHAQFTGLRAPPTSCIWCTYTTRACWCLLKHWLETSKRYCSSTQSFLKSSHHPTDYYSTVVMVITHPSTPRSSSSTSLHLHIYSCKRTAASSKRSIDCVRHLSTPAAAMSSTHLPGCDTIRWASSNAFVCLRKPLITWKRIREETGNKKTKRGNTPPRIYVRTDVALSTNKISEWIPIFHLFFYYRHFFFFFNFDFFHLPSFFLLQNQYSTANLYFPSPNVSAFYPPFSCLICLHSAMETPLLRRKRGYSA